LHVVAEPKGPSAATWSNNLTGEVTYQQAINEALRVELMERPEVVVFGEDVGHAGGIFGCTRNLQREFGEARVFDTPIAEASILGAAVGAAMCGMKPVAEIMWMDFLMVAMDQLVNQAANIRYVSRGAAHVPMVMRVQQGATPGSCSQHSQSLEAMLAHVPGLKVGLPATAQDAYDMLRAAIDDPDPCIIIEARSLYQTKGIVDGARTAVGTAHQRRKGSDVAIISWGTMANTAEQAADLLNKEGVQASVLDLRWLSPLDEKALEAAVRGAKGRALIVHEANQTGGFGAEIVSRLLELGFTKIRRLGAPDIRVPASPVLQAALIPSADLIAKTAKTLIKNDTES
jgi:2-oxoisovalerate dehydrogenase E1 component